MGVGKRFGPMADSALAAEDSSPGLFVTLRVCDETIRIPCGDGGQSLRWLSQVAAQRYTMLHAAKGRPRQRETHTEPQGAFLPRNVFATTSGAMLGPSMTVKEALGAVTGAGADPAAPLISVELTRAPELTPDGAVALSTWSALAFKFSDGGRALASKLLASDEAASVHEQQEQERREEEDRRRQVLEFWAELDATVTAGDREKVEALARRPWPLVNLGLVAEDRLAQLALKRSILSRFPILADVFRYFSSRSAVSQSDFWMAYSEFRHMVDICGIFQFPRDAALLDRLISVALPPKLAGAPRGVRLMCLDYLEVLLVLAKQRYSSERRSDGSTFAMDACPALERLVDTYLVPLVSKVNVGPVRSLLRTSDVHRALSSVSAPLYDVLAWYSPKGREESFMCLTIPTLATVLTHAALLPPGTPGTEEASQREAKRLFETVQEHVLADGSQGLRRAGEGGVMTEMTLCEFMEAIVTAGVARWPGSDASDVAKACKALQVVARLADAPGVPFSSREVDNAFASSAKDDVFLTEADMSLTEGV